MLRRPLVESTVDCSEATAREIDEEVREMLDASYREALAILQEHRDALDRVAAHLLERETLDRQEFESLVAQREEPRLGTGTEP